MFGDTATHTLSPVQLVAGSDRRIHHGINLARDAINQAGKPKVGCGLLDLDFMAGFDWLDMTTCPGFIWFLKRKELIQLL